MAALDAFLEQQGYVVLDGGLATELEKRGESLDDPLWSAKTLLRAPEKIEEVHYAYFCAGADVAITASYQATYAGLEAAGLTHDQADEIFRLSVTIAEDARTRFWNTAANRANRLRPIIAASIGPYGAFLHDGSEYRGNYGVSRGELSDFHAERLATLTECGPDVLACESIPSMMEAEVVAGLLKAEAWISFTCKDEAHISDGTPFAEAVAAVCDSPWVVAIGVNCTSAGFVGRLLEEARRITDKPLVAYPNANDGGAINASGWRERGARLIGGCCKTTPQVIREIRSALVCGGSK